MVQLGGGGTLTKLTLFLKWCERVFSHWSKSTPRLFILDQPYECLFTDTLAQMVAHSSLRGGRGSHMSLFHWLQLWRGPSPHKPRISNGPWQLELVMHDYARFRCHLTRCPGSRLSSKGVTVDEKTAFTNEVVSQPSISWTEGCKVTHLRENNLQGAVPQWLFSVKHDLSLLIG